MTADPDHVQVVAKQLHTQFCLLGSKSDATYSREHWGTHQRGAERFLAGMANAGYTLATKAEAA